MSEVVHVAFIGCGHMARSHMKIIQQYVPKIHIRATMDISEEAAKSAYMDFKADYYTSEVDRVLKDPEVNAVYICTRHDTHVPVGKKAAEAGKNIFMEKPLALTIEKCKEMEDTVRSTGIKFMSGFPQRFSTLSQRARELVPKPTMTWGRQTQGRWDDNAWYQDPIQGGGNVLSTGCHTFDLVCWFNPSKPVQVYAQGGTMRHSNKDVIDTATAVIRFENGSVATAMVADCAPVGLPMMAYELLGEGHGAFILNWQELWYNSEPNGVGNKIDVKLRIPEGRRAPWDYGLIQESEAFADYILHGGPSPVPVEDGTRATLLVLQTFKSIRTGRPQEINLD